MKALYCSNGFVIHLIIQALTYLHFRRSILFCVGLIKMQYLKVFWYSLKYMQNALIQESLKILFYKTPLVIKNEILIDYQRENHKNKYTTLTFSPFEIS